MDCDTANRIPLKDLLARLDYLPAQVSRNGAWYLSPLRSETRPSFKVNEARNVWFDFGIAEGGDVVAFAKRYWQTDTSHALHQIDKVWGGPIPASRPPAPTPPPAFQDVTWRLVDIREAVERSQASRVLDRYLASRGIDLDRVWGLLREVHYTLNGKPGFALGFKNESEGWEIRNSFLKASIGPKDISFREGKKNGPVCVFEGFMDALSARVLGWIPQGASVLVMNSAGLTGRTIERIQNHAPASVHLYLDNDPAGREASNKLMAAFDGIAADESGKYLGYKDVNDYLTGRGRGR